MTNLENKQLELAEKEQNLKDEIDLGFDKIIGNGKKVVKVTFLIMLVFLVKSLISTRSKKDKLQKKRFKGSGFLAFLIPYLLDYGSKVFYQRLKNKS